MFPAYETNVYETKTYPVEKIGIKLREYVCTKGSGMLWQLQQEVFEAKMATLKHAIREGYVLAGSAEIMFDITVVQPVISAEATDGRDIELQKDSHYFTVAVSKFEDRLR